MVSWPRSDSKQRIRGRPTSLAIMGTLALATIWIAVAIVWAPHLIRSAYRGESFAFLDHLIASRAAHPLDESLARWGVFAWSGLGVVLSAGSFLVIATRPGPGWLVRLGPPVVVFLLARSLLWVGFAAAPMHSVFDHRRDGSPARYASGFDLEAWSRWDSHVYMTIARQGYELFPCDIPADGVPIATAGRWCGDTPWFPGYPALIWLLARVGVPELPGGVLISAAFCLATLFLLWTGFLGAQRTVKGFLVLLFAGLFPGAIYFHAVYPISMATFFIVLSLHFLVRGRWLLGGLSGTAAALAYPGAALLAAVLAPCVLYGCRELPWGARLWRSMAAGGMVAAGVALVFAVQRLFVGTWDAFLGTQAQYDVAGYMPILTLRPVLDKLTQLLHADWAHAGFRDWAALSMPAGKLFVTFVALMFVVFAVREARRSSGTTQGSAAPMVHLAIFLLVFLVVPLALPRYSLTRRQALMLPAAPLALILPEWMLGAIVLLASILVPLLGAMYFAGSLI